jgi:ABC-type glycerol-3-phosphate transport system permease component
MTRLEEIEQAPAITPGDSIDRPMRRAPSRRWDRLGRYIAAKGWVHVISICGVCIFLFPFVWMVGMSLKTDEEATSTAIFPTIPTFQANSPVVRKPAPFFPPMDVAPKQWREILPKLKQAARGQLNPLPLPPGGDAVNASALRDSAAMTMVGQTIEKMPEAVWKQSDDQIVKAFTALLTPADLASALNDRLGRLSFRNLQIRTLDAQIKNVFNGPEIAAQWKVESGNGQLKPGADDAYLQYHFNSADDPPIVLRADFTFPVDPDQLHKLIVGMTGDNSWHHIDATLDIGNRRWVSDLTTYIAQYRAGSIIFQPPGFDDTTYQPHDWVPLDPTTKAAPAANVSPRAATLRLYIRPSSTLGAIYGKVQRNYRRAFRAVPFWTYLGNSVLLVALQLVGSLFSAAFVAYAFARLNWPGKSIAFGLLLSTMMLPSQVTMIPGFVIWKSLGWYNTLNPLWIGSWFGSAFFIFLMVQNMKTIPRALEEAARIDGLNAVQTWWYIILPQVKPAMAAIAIMVFQGAWNDFMGPLIMLRDQARFPLSLGLFGMKVDQGGDWTLVMAGNMLMALPVILIFFLFQRYFIEGMTVSGMKG